MTDIIRQLYLILSSRLRGKNQSSISTAHQEEERKVRSLSKCYMQFLREYVKFFSVVSTVPYLFFIFRQIGISK